MDFSYIGSLTFFCVAWCLAAASIKNRVPYLALSSIFAALISIFHFKDKIGVTEYFFSILGTVSFIAIFLVHFLVRFIQREFRSKNRILKIGGYIIPVDNRTGIICASFFVSMALTGHFHELMRQKILISQGFYASWTSNLLFFITLGLALALVGLRNPEREPFSRRLSILFSSADEREMKYYSSLVQEMGYVAVTTKRTIKIQEYSPQYKALKLYNVLESEVRNCFDDIEHSHEPVFGFTPDPIEGANAPEVLGQLLRFSCKDVVIAQPQTVDKRGLSIPVAIDLDVGESANIFVEYWVWQPLAESVQFAHQRFTRHAVVEIANQLDEKYSTVEILDADGESISIEPGGVEIVSDERCVAKGDGYKFTFVAPEQVSEPCN